MQSELETIKDTIREILADEHLSLCDNSIRMLGELLELNPDIPDHIPSMRDWFADNVDKLPLQDQVSKLKTICYKQEQILINATKMHDEYDRKIKEIEAKIIRLTARL